MQRCYWKLQWEEWIKDCLLQCICCRRSYQLPNFECWGHTQHRKRKLSALGWQKLMKLGHWCLVCSLSWQPLALRRESNKKSLLKWSWFQSHWGKWWLWWGQHFDWRRGWMQQWIFLSCMRRVRQYRFDNIQLQFVRMLQLGRRKRSWSIECIPSGS